MNETKMLSFEEWKRLPEIVGASSMYYEGAEHAWEAARQGMIPAENAIAVPEVWPEGMNLIVCHFTGHTLDEWSLLANAALDIARIPRPTPAWTPKIGEAVFAWTSWNHTPVWIGRVSSITSDSLVNVICSDGEETPWRIMNLKPFSIEAIGKKWNEI